MLLLVRHGQRADDQKAFYDGPAFDTDFDPPLTKLGREQAFKSGLKIKQTWLFPSKPNKFQKSEAESPPEITIANSEGQNEKHEQLSQFSHFLKNKQQQSKSNESQQQQKFLQEPSFSHLCDKKHKQLLKNDIESQFELDDEQNDYDGKIMSNMTLQEMEQNVKNKEPEYHTIQIITSPFLRCLQTSVHLAKGMGLQPDQIKLNVNWTLGQYMAPSFFSSWKSEDSPLNGLSINRLDHSTLLSGQLEGIVSDVVKNESQKKPEYPEHISQCKNRYRKLIQDIMVNNFRGQQNRGKLIIIVSHGHSAEEFMRLFNPTKQLNSVDYCAISLAVKKSFKEVDEFPEDIPPAGDCGAYGPWRLKVTSDARHIGLGKASLIQID